MTPSLQSRSPGQQRSFIDECWADAAPSPQGRLRVSEDSGPPVVQERGRCCSAFPLLPRPARGNTNAEKHGVETLLSCDPAPEQMMTPRIQSTPRHIRDEWREEFEKRAGIMEYEGGLPRDRAEALALADILHATKEKTPAAPLPSNIGERLKGIVTAITGEPVRVFTLPLGERFPGEPEWRISSGLHNRLAQTKGWM